MPSRPILSAPAHSYDPAYTLDDAPNPAWVSLHVVLETAAPVVLGLYFGKAARKSGVTTIPLLHGLGIIAGLPLGKVSIIPPASGGKWFSTI